MPLADRRAAWPRGTERRHGRRTPSDRDRWSHAEVFDRFRRNYQQCNAEANPTDARMYGNRSAREKMTDCRHAAMPLVTRAAWPRVTERRHGRRTPSEVTEDPARSEERRVGKERRSRGGA